MLQVGLSSGNWRRRKRGGRVGGGRHTFVEGVVVGVKDGCTGGLLPGGVFLFLSLLNGPVSVLSDNDQRPLHVDV